MEIRGQGARARHSLRLGQEDCDGGTIGWGLRLYPARLRTPRPEYRFRGLRDRRGPRPGKISGRFAFGLGCQGATPSARKQFGGERGDNPRL